MDFVMMRNVKAKGALVGVERRRCDGRVKQAFGPMKTLRCLPLVEFELDEFANRLSGPLKSALELNHNDLQCRDFKAVTEHIEDFQACSEACLDQAVGVLALHKLHEFRNV